MAMDCSFRRKSLTCHWAVNFKTKSLVLQLYCTRLLVHLTQPIVDDSNCPERTANQSKNGNDELDCIIIVKDTFPNRFANKKICSNDWHSTEYGMMVRVFDESNWVEITEKERKKKLKKISPSSSDAVRQMAYFGISIFVFFSQIVCSRRRVYMQSDSTKEMMVKLHLTFLLLFRKAESACHHQVTIAFVFFFSFLCCSSAISLLNFYLFSLSFGSQFFCVCSQQCWGPRTWHNTRATSHTHAQTHT